MLTLKPIVVHLHSKRYRLRSWNSLKRVLFKARIPRLSQGDLEAILSLAEGGFSFQETLELLENTHNHMCFERMKGYLAQGVNPDAFMKDYLPKPYASLFTSFQGNLPFLKAVRLAFNLGTKNQKQKRAWEKRLAYPLTLLFLSTIGLVLFLDLVLPALLQMMKGFGTDSGSLAWLGGTASVFSKVLLLVVLFLLAMVYYFLQPKHQPLGYVLLSQKFKNSMIHQALSAKFSVFWKECADLGCGTQEILGLLRGLQSMPLIVFMCYHIEKELLVGKDFGTALESPYLDEAFVRCMKLAMFTPGRQNMLESYIDLAEKRAAKQCKQLGQGIQACVYLLIGFIIILVYQVLLSPLAVISQM